jgi:hypothetical protein
MPSRGMYSERTLYGILPASLPADAPTRTADTRTRIRPPQRYLLRGRLPARRSSAQLLLSPLPTGPSLRPLNARTRTVLRPHGLPNLGLQRTTCRTRPVQKTLYEGVLCRAPGGCGRRLINACTEESRGVINFLYRPIHARPLALQYPSPLASLLDRGSTARPCADATWRD